MILKPKKHPLLEKCQIKYSLNDSFRIRCQAQFVHCKSKEVCNHNVLSLEMHPVMSGFLLTIMHNII